MHGASFCFWVGVCVCVVVEGCHAVHAFAQRIAPACSCLHIQHEYPRMVPACYSSIVYTELKINNEGPHLLDAKVLSIVIGSPLNLKPQTLNLRPRSASLRPESLIFKALCPSAQVVSSWHKSACRMQLAWLGVIHQLGGNIGAEVVRIGFL